MQHFFVVHILLGFKVQKKLREVPFWNVVRVYGHCPRIFSSDVMASISKEKLGYEKVSNGARLIEGGESKAIWAMPLYTDCISKRGFPYRSCGNALKSNFPPLPLHRMQEKIIELKRVQSILSRPTKHDEPPGIGLNAFLPPKLPACKNGRK